MVVINFIGFRAELQFWKENRELQKIALKAETAAEIAHCLEQWNQPSTKDQLGTVSKGQTN
jgi:hypothetical protein